MFDAEDFEALFVFFPGGMFSLRTSAVRSGGYLSFPSDKTTPKLPDRVYTILENRVEVMGSAASSLKQRYDRIESPTKVG